MDLNDVVSEIMQAVDDQGLPRRVREGLERVAGDLEKSDGDKAVTVTTAVYDLEEIAGDVNIPMHAKTLIWDVISTLEGMKK